MKQIIGRNNDGRINNKYYLNDRGELHGLYIRYWSDGEIFKGNYINGKLHGLAIWFYRNNKGKLEQQKYYL